MAELYIDLETTGLPPYNAHVVEVAAVAIGEGGTEIGHFATFVNPGSAALLGADPKAMAVHGIPVPDIESAPPTEQVARDLAAFLETHAGTRLHAFNNQFEAGILTCPPWAVEPARWGECVMLAAMRVIGAAGALRRRTTGDLKWPTLDEAASFFGVPRMVRHRALDDARTTARVHRALLLRDEKEEESLSDEVRLLMEDGL
jgi:DNA polymerase III epsilon subunit-like protein